MKLEKFKEKDKKRTSIIVFTIVCILLVSGVILYRTFAIFEVNTTQNIINGNVGSMGDLEFVFYKDDVITKTVPEEDGYAFDSSKSYCLDRSTGTQVSNVSWNKNAKTIELNDISELGKVKCYLHFNKIYQESELNGAIPDLGNGRLVPITYDTTETNETGPVVKKANIMDTDNPWYSYKNKQWANAVITGNSYDLLGTNVHGATKEENSVHFDGENDYIDLGLANYDFKNQMTLSATFTVNTFTERPQILTNTDSAGAGIYIDKANNTYRFVAEFNQGSSNYTRLYSDTGVVLGQEYNVILRFDQGTLQLYINGKIEKTATSLNNYVVAITPYILGANPGPNYQNWYTNINIKQAAIFNRAIGEDEIANISNNFKITNGRGLLKYVDFTNKIYEPGEVISEDNIESYFVWIPRFEYEIWNGQAETNEFTGIKEELGTVENTTQNDKLNKAQEINIRFVTKEDTIKYGMNKGEWLTHPAFTAFDVNGMWVGKFETSKSSDETSNSISPELVQIKPGVTSWRNIQVANAFYTTYNYKRELDSHMMKNMEWGAVAYLTNSKYGRCDEDGNCSEVRINNNSSYTTGSSAVKAPTCGYTGTNIDCNKYGTGADLVNPYSNPKSVESSTTDNYYGIFDMAGGAWEYVMGVMLDENGKPASGRHNVYNSGFVGTLTCPTCTDTNVTPDKDKTTWTADDKDKGLAWPDSRYYDTYGYKTSNQYYDRGHLGDGAAEFGPFYSVQYKTGSGEATMTRQVSGWNADGAFFVHHGIPWFMRGGAYYYGADAGTSAFDNTYGHAYDYGSFRVVLTP